MFDLIEDSSNCMKRTKENKRRKNHDKKHGCRCHSRNLICLCQGHRYYECDDLKHEHRCNSCDHTCRCHQNHQCKCLDRNHHCDCHEGNHHDDWHDLKHDCDCFKRHHNCGCHCHICTDRCDCDKLFRINLAGLRGNLNYKLLENRNRIVEIITTGRFKLRGKTHRIGIDFVELECSDKIITILKDKIDHIRWY